MKPGRAGHGQVLAHVPRAAAPVFAVALIYPGNEPDDSARLWRAASLPWRPASSWLSGTALTGDAVITTRELKCNGPPCYLDATS